MKINTEILSKVKLIIKLQKYIIKCNKANICPKCGKNSVYNNIGHLWNECLHCGWSDFDRAYGNYIATDDDD